MKEFIHWAVFLLLLMGILGPAYLGLQFTQFAYYLLFAGVTAIAILLVMRQVHKSIPLENTPNKNDKDAQ